MYFFGIFTHNILEIRKKGAHQKMSKFAVVKAAGEGGGDITVAIEK